MVCQEKNVIIEIFLKTFWIFLQRNDRASMEFVKNYDPSINSAAFYSENFSSYVADTLYDALVGELGG